MPPRVLVVDDDETFCGVLAAALTRRGFAVETAFDGATALAAAGRSKPDFVVLDLRIAAENGLDLVPGLCAASAGVRIVVLTGYASIATAVEAIKRGAHHYLTKPIEMTALLAAFGLAPGPADVAPVAAPTPLERVEWEYIQQALLEADGNVTVAAARLGLHRRTLQRKLKKRPAGMQ